MTRYFSKPVKREALARSGLRCEAVGPMYGLPEGVRCNANLGAGFDFDHIVLWADSRDSSLDNVAVVCRPCHRAKTEKHDTPRAAKTQRMQDKANGIRSERAVIPGSRKSRWKRTIDGRTIEREP